MLDVELDVVVGTDVCVDAVIVVRIVVVVDVEAHNILRTSFSLRSRSA